MHAATASATADGATGGIAVTAACCARARRAMKRSQSAHRMAVRQRVQTIGAVREQSQAASGRMIGSG